MASLPLAELLSVAETTATVLGSIVDASGSGVLTIESEQISYTGNSDNQFFGLVRGYNGTTPADHIANKAVVYVPSVIPGIIVENPEVTGQQTIVNTEANTDALTITNTTPSRGLLVNGKIVARRDNGSSLVVRGLQSPTEGVAVVSSYSGIFTDPGYSDTGTLDTRFLMGGNNEMDVELQSPHSLRLTGAANDTNDGNVRICATTNVKIMARGANEANAPKYLVVDRVDETIHADPLTNNSSDVVLKANAGSLRLNYGVTDGAVVLPSLSNAQRSALTPVAGMFILNSDTGLLNVYDGSAWKAVDVSAV